jgi:hypothetical protein
VLNIPFLTNGIEGGIIFLVDKRDFAEKYLLEFDPGEAGGEVFPPKADTGTTRLLDDCFHIVKGERDNFLSSILSDAAGDVDTELLPFSTITKPPLLLSSDCECCESLFLYAV